MRSLPLIDVAGATSEEVWSDFFAKRRPGDRLLRESVLQLVNAARHEEVIALIEAALIHGQPQAWMYEVLAFSYELAGRPKEDIERALLSAVDPQVDYETAILSAVYLARFKNRAPALRMYRQASQLVPFRPEPYIMALPIAREHKDVEAIAWAVEGVLHYAWTGDYAKLHRDAEFAAQEALQIIQERGDKDLEQRFTEVYESAKQRDLVIELTWSGQGDVDLLVDDPSGATCSFEIAFTAAGGVHLRDGYGPRQENCNEKYVCVKGLSGTYRIKVRHVWGNIVGGKAFLRVTEYQGTPRETVKNFTVALEPEDRVVPIVLQHGRRQRIDPGLEQSSRKVSLWRATSRPTFAQAMQGMTPEQQRVIREFQETRQNNPVLAIANGAVGYAPIVRTINDGLQLGATAVVSPDRRYVRVGISPQFNEIIDVFTFTLFGGNGNGAGQPNGN